MNNRVSNLIPESHFYSDLNVGSQQPNQSFGPVTGNETTQFRTTSSFTTSGNVKAYAICTGQVFIQPSTISGKVNLILRPYRQPIKGLSIKYFVYRGLKKTDFLPSGDENLIGFSDSSSASELIQVLWTQLKGFNDWTDQEAAAATFKAKWIGYDPSNQEASSLIDDYFFMTNPEGNTGEEVKAFDFPMIKQGVHLGDFTGEYGLDIVLSEGDYKLSASDTGFEFDLIYARAASVVLDTANLPANTSEKQFRETIFQFLDPAAYWGLHFPEGGKLWVRSGTESIKKEQQQIYDEVLASYLNKNKVYLYIQSELGRSYNFYENYSAAALSNTPVVKLGATDATMAASAYATSSWPYLIIEQSQSHTANENKWLLQLIVEEKEDSPICYGQLAMLEDKAENNFLIEDQLIPEQPAPVEGQPTQVNLYSKPITLRTSAVAGTSGNQVNVASCIKLLYKAAPLTATETTAEGEAQHVLKEIDGVFGPINVFPRFQGLQQEEISWCVNSKNNIINSQRIKPTVSSKMAVQSKIVFDKLAYQLGGETLVQDRVVFETQLIEGIGNGVLNRNSSISTSESAGSIPFSKENNNFYMPRAPYAFNINLIFDDNQTISGLELINLEEKGIHNKYLLGLIKEELVAVQTKVQEEGLRNSKLFLKPLFKVEPKVTGYRKYSLLILGETQNSVLKVVNMETEIIVYSYDRHYFVSKQYSDYMTKRELLLIPDFTL